MVNSCTKDDLIKLFALDMVSNSLRKMSDIHKNISIFERKVNAALVVAQDKPTSVVKNYNSGKYYLMKYTDLRDGLCWNHKSFGSQAYGCEHSECRKRGDSKNSNLSS